MCVCLLLLLLWCVCICGVACHVVDLGLSHLAVAKLFQEMVSRDCFQSSFFVFKNSFIGERPLQAGGGMVFAMPNSLAESLCRL